MSRIIDDVADLLRQHKDKLRGSIHQEPYKGDFFKLFAKAFNSGLIDHPGQTDYHSADAIGAVLGAIAPELTTGDTYQAFLCFWSEWTYAWRHRDQCTR